MGSVVIWWRVVSPINRCVANLALLALMMPPAIGLALSELLSVRANSGRDLAEDLLKSDLVPGQPLYIVEGLDIDEAVWRQRCQRVESIVPCIREVGSHGCGDLVCFEEVHDLVPLPLQVRVHLPN